MWYKRDLASDSMQQRLAFAGAVLMAIGMVYGLVVLGAMTGAIPGDAVTLVEDHLGGNFADRRCDWSDGYLAQKLERGVSCQDHHGTFFVWVGKPIPTELK